MESREVLRALGSVKQIEKSRTVFSQYDTGAEMYIVLKGTFGVYVNSLTGFPTCVATIGAGSFFGEMAAIDGMPRSATVIALDDSTVVVVKKDNFALLLEKAPDIASAIFETMRKRVKATEQSLRSAGIDVPDTDGAMDSEKFENAQASFDLMVKMAWRVREMNALLVCASEEKKTAEHTAGQQPPGTAPSGKIRLLPEGYKHYNIPDRQIQRSNLRKARLICPYCSSAFDSHIPLMSGLVKARECPDGRIVYSNINILLYSNTVCPQCNYTDIYFEFGKPRDELQVPVYSGNQFENEEGFNGWQNEYSRSLDEVIMSYYLSIHCLERVSGDALRLANAWIRLYWLYGDQGSTELALRAAEQAYKHYGEYSEKSMNSLPLDSRMRLYAVMGELSAALGEHDRAIKFYGEIAELGKTANLDFIKEAKKRAAELKKMA